MFIPHYCWHPALTVVASCRMCLVEVGDTKPDGTVAMQPKVVPACQTPAKDGTVIVTNSPKAKHAQEQTLEGLLLNHPLDCPVCDKAGECLLQDYSYRFGQSAEPDDRREEHAAQQAAHRRATSRCSPTAASCARAASASRARSAATAELQVINRGDHSEIDIFPGEPLNNKLAGNVVDLCPVGALCSKDFLYKQRVWYLKTQNERLPRLHHRLQHLRRRQQGHRLSPAAARQSAGPGLFHVRRGPARLPLRQLAASASCGRWPGATASWSPLALGRGAAGAAPRAGRGGGQRRGSAVVGVLSPFLTCEEAYLLARFLKGLSGQVRLALGPVPVVGEDDTYPKDRRGRPVQPVKFTIRAEKCPNRRGVEEVLRHFQGEVIAFDDVLRAAGEGEVQALYLAAGYPPRPGGWISEAQAAALEAGAAAGRARICCRRRPATSLITSCPAASFAEKDGTFVNHAGLAQAIHWARHADRRGAARDGQVFLDLLERRGLVHAPTLRKELAGEVPYFAPLAGGRPRRIWHSLWSRPK